VREVLVASSSAPARARRRDGKGGTSGLLCSPKAETEDFSGCFRRKCARNAAGKNTGKKANGLRSRKVFDEVIERDKRDRERKVSPLIRAADAVLVDNTAMGIEETARLIVMLAREREKESAEVAGGQTVKRTLVMLALSAGSALFVVPAAGGRTDQFRPD